MTPSEAVNARGIASGALFVPPAALKIPKRFRPSAPPLLYRKPETLWREKFVRFQASLPGGFEHGEIPALPWWIDGDLDLIESLWFATQQEDITATGAWSRSVPSGSVSLVADFYGSGGGGGGAGGANGGGGGGSGAYVQLSTSILSGEIGATIQGEIAVGGPGGANGTNGTNGETTTLATVTLGGSSRTINAPGGVAGLGSLSGSTGGAGGTPATGGTTNTDGSAGAARSGGNGGDGGSAPGPAGGTGGAGGVSGSSNASPGNPPGGGGGGGRASGTVAQRIGGDGARGQVSLLWTIAESLPPRDPLRHMRHLLIR